MAGYADRLEGERTLTVLGAWMQVRIANGKRIESLDHYLDWFKPPRLTSPEELLAGFRGLQAAGLPITITEIPPENQQG
jgi:hypothetical protein